MDIWHYDPDTGELVGMGMADPNPLSEGGFLIPAHATTGMPPEAQQGMARIFRDSTWSHVADHRGETWWDASGSPTIISSLGDPSALGLVSIAPPPPEPGPIVVSASAAKLVLDDDGLYTQVETICKNHEVAAVRIFWESANTWVEDNPYVLAIGTELGLTTEQMHDKFVRAIIKDAAI